MTENCGEPWSAKPWRGPAHKGKCLYYSNKQEANICSVSSFMNFKICGSVG